MKILHCRTPLTIALLALLACGDDSAAFDGGADAPSDAPLADGATSDAPAPDAVSSDAGMDAPFDAVTDAGDDACIMCGGECVDTDVDPQHCGACDTPCVAGANETATCVGGSCERSCTEGFDDCDGDPTSGCEADLSTPTHCGACGNACSAANAASTCTEGICAFTCSGGYDDCDGEPSNGCEADLTSPMNCLACGTVCAGDNATGVCASGGCSLMCDGGYDDCDGMASNGCETDLSTPLNCRSCGNTCPSGPNSSALCGDTCTLVCAEGYADCDGNPVNGCEVDLSSVNDCGSCDNVCPGVTNGTATCDGSSCGLSCDAGYATCGPVALCSTDLSGDRDNCGACGVRCEPSPTVANAQCVMGACDLECAPERGNCDGNPANGCEVNVAFDLNNCGSCGNACPAGNSCDGGGCIPRRLAFVTSTTVVPNTLGSLSAADAICQARASAAGLSGAFRAWLSTSSSFPFNRFVRSINGYARTDGATIAENWADLTDGTIDVPLNRDEFGALVPDSSGGSGTCSFSNVITGTRADGTVQTSFTCNSYTGGATAIGTAAETRATNSRWTAGCGGTSMCNAPKRLYCFQQ